MKQTKQTHQLCPTKDAQFTCFTGTKVQILTQLRYYVRPCQGPRYLLSLLALLVQKYRNWHLTCTAQGALGGSGVQIVHNSLLMRFFNAVFFFCTDAGIAHVCNQHVSAVFAVCSMSHLKILRTVSTAASEWVQKGNTLPNLLPAELVLLRCTFPSAHLTHRLEKQIIN